MADDPSGIDAKLAAQRDQRTRELEDIDRTPGQCAAIASALADTFRDALRVSSIGDDFFVEAERREPEGGGDPTWLVSGRYQKDRSLYFTVQITPGFQWVPDSEGSYGPGKYGCLVNRSSQSPLEYSRGVEGPYKPLITMDQVGPSRDGFERWVIDVVTNWRPKEVEPAQLNIASPYPWIAGAITLALLFLLQR